MSPPPEVVTGFEFAVMGASLGTLFGELSVSLLSMLRPSLAVVLAGAALGSLAAAASSSVIARRFDGYGKAALSALPGLCTSALLTGCAWAVWP